MRYTVDRSSAIVLMPSESIAANSPPPRYAIRIARRSDLPWLAAIELDAAALLSGHAPPSVLALVTPPEELEKAASQNLLWVALADDVPVGFAHVMLLEPDNAHLQELDVHPQHGRRGLGRKLVLAVCDWAAALGYGVTLCTFRDVPWNMPFYERLGFEVVASDELSPVLASIVANETERGLDPAHRVVMRWRSEKRDSR